MRKSVLGAAVALSIAIAGGTLIAYGQPAQPAGPAPTGPFIGAPQTPGGGQWGQWRRSGEWREGMAQRRQMRMRTFALFFRPADRQLTPPDVRKIAEAFLLWNGNHTWKVIDVAPTSDGQVSFSYAAPDNTVIARFSMDTKTGHVTRIG
jgi:hypothetical protein